MRHMGNSGKTAIGASLAALALLVLAGATLHETVGLWFLAAAAVAYIACVAEVLVRRRYKTLLASGIGSILFIAFGIAFLRQWGLAFNPDPDALATNVDTEHPDLYFYLAAAAGAATLLLLLAGTVVPGRRPATRPDYASRRPASAARGPAPRRPAPRGAAPSAARGAAPSAARGAGPSAARGAAPPRTPAARTSTSAAKRPASSSKSAATSQLKPAVKAPARPAAKSPTRR
jgi:hypothetical protein